MRELCYHFVINGTDSSKDKQKSQEFFVRRNKKLRFVTEKSKQLHVSEPARFCRISRNTLDNWKHKKTGNNWPLFIFACSQFCI